MAVVIIPIFIIIVMWYTDEWPTSALHVARPRRTISDQGFQQSRLLILGIDWTQNLICGWNWIFNVLYITIHAALLGEDHATAPRPVVGVVVEPPMTPNHTDPSE
jgi:hypothetical protein